MSNKDLTQFSQNTRPCARKADLSITRVGDETVVYDLLTHKAFCLNTVTAAVWGACDGNSDTCALLDAIRHAGFQDATEDVVWLALDQLDQSELLEVFEITDTKVKNLNRRKMLRTLGKGAASVIPVVSTINIQPAIAQASCGGFLDPCPCCTGYVCVGGFICLGPPPPP